MSTKNNTNTQEIATQATTELNKDLQSKLVKQYTNALLKQEKSAWELCEVVNKTVTRKDFTKAFHTHAEYAQAIGKSQTYITQMVSAWNLRCKLLERGLDMTLGAVLEMVPSCYNGRGKKRVLEIPDRITDAIVDGQITEETTSKEMREICKTPSKKKEKAEKEELKKALEEIRENGFIDTFKIVPIYNDGTEDTENQFLLEDNADENSLEHKLFMAMLDLLYK